MAQRRPRQLCPYRGRDVGTLFEMLARETVSSPTDADVAVTDEEVSVREGAQIVRSCDFEKVMALMG